MQLTDIEVTYNNTVYHVLSFEVKLIKATEDYTQFKVIPNSIVIMDDQDNEVLAPYLADVIANQKQNYIEDKLS